MIETECIPFAQTGYFSKLICDYLAEKPNLLNLYNRYPSLENVEAQIKEKDHFSDQNREVLSTVLNDQYKPYELNEESIQISQIQSLTNKNTFTVTTGHQLNLFSGPLYFIYKICSVVNMAKALNQKYPEQHFVPVYWMATEDHDFAEINHINHFGGRISWDSPEASGPVGRLVTDSMQEVLKQLENVLDKGKRGDYILDLFKKAYLKQPNLAKATHYFVHELFKETELLILDADDARLKKLAIPYFKKDLIENIGFNATRKNSEYLAENYTEQVHVREINLFYMQDGLRERIERHGNTWQVLNTETQFSEAELINELEEHPERFSPNVVMRPLYQEVILPNLSYTGGGGELAYWLQLKDMFEAMEVPFPILHLRNSVLWIPKRLHRKMQKVGVSTEDLFKPLHELTNNYVTENSELPAKLHAEYEHLKNMFARIETLAQQTDKGMQTAVAAQYTKQTKGLDNLNKKLLKAEKKQHEVAVRQLTELKEGLFPANSLQERHQNVVRFYMDYGDAFISTLLDKLNPFDFEFTVLKEEV